MPVEFYKGAVGSEASEFFKGTLDDLAIHVNEDALVEWDRFTEANGISDIDKDYLRFVRANDVWRAFGGHPLAVSGGPDGFIGEWQKMKMEIKSKEGLILIVETGRWSLQRSSAPLSQRCGIADWIPMGDL